MISAIVTASAIGIYIIKARINAIIPHPLKVSFHQVENQSCLNRF